MGAPSIRPVRNCLYGRHIECTRRHSYQPGSRALVGAPANAPVHIVERTSDIHLLQNSFQFRSGMLKYGNLPTNDL